MLVTVCTVWRSSFSALFRDVNGGASAYVCVEALSCLLRVSAGCVPQCGGGCLLFEALGRDGAVGCRWFMKHPDSV